MKPKPVFQSRFVSLTLLCVLCLCTTGVSAEKPEAVTEKPEAERETKPPAPAPFPPELAALLKYKPVTNPTRKQGRTVVAATRSGNNSDIKLVALAPGSGGITTLPQPRLWWWQSEATEAGELEFTLTRMEGRPTVAFSVKLGALNQGFNAIDLSMTALNKEGVKLDPEVEYQWTLGCLDRLDKSSVFVRLTHVDKPDLAARLKTAPTAPSTLSALSESGNWYELFDIVALSSRLNPADETTAGIRDRLLGQLGLDAAVQP